MKLYLYISCVFFMLMNCGNDSCSYAIIGGEIINKNTDYVILYNAKKVIDTVKLDGNNRFSYKIENLNPGVHTFRHGGEIQMVLLEPGDSIMFRLNTFEFDESLVYTGKGAKKNNYLINDFLKSEVEEKQIFKLCQLSPGTFEKCLDSIKEKKNRKLYNFQEKYKSSELFNKIAQANIDYGYYSSKEMYPLIHYGYNKKKTMKSLPKNFYEYREGINYNDTFLKDHFNYISFLKARFNNLGLDSHLSHSKENKFRWAQLCYNDLCYNLDRLEAIDSLVDNPDIKNDLLYHYSISFISKNMRIENNDKVIQSFLAKCTNKEKNDLVVSYNNSINRLKPGNAFPDIQLLNIQNNVVNIGTLFKKPTVVYFWSHMFKSHLENSHERVKELTAKYPEVGFISINIDAYSRDRWASSIKKKKLPLENEFMFKNTEKSIEKLAIYPLTKVFLVDQKSKIVNGHTNMFENGFEEQLLGLLSK